MLLTTVDGGIEWHESTDENGIVSLNRRWALSKPLSDELKAQLPAIRESLQAGMRPAGREALAIELGKLALHFWHPDRSKAQWQTLMKDYLEDLSEYPLEDFKDVCREWRRHEKWWPKIAELREPLEDTRIFRRFQIDRLQKIERALLSGSTSGNG